MWHAVWHAVVHAGAPSSLMEARHTPPMTGIRQSHLAFEMGLPYTNCDSTAPKAGSAALTIWPNDTAPALMAKTDAQWAIIAQKATGTMAFTSSNVIDGALRMSGAAHANKA